MKFDGIEFDIKDIVQKRFKGNSLTAIEMSVIKGFIDAMYEQLCTDSSGSKEYADNIIAETKMSFKEIMSMKVKE